MAFSNWTLKWPKYNKNNTDSKNQKKTFWVQNDMQEKKLLDFSLK